MHDDNYEIYKRSQPSTFSLLMYGFSLLLIGFFIGAALIPQHVCN